MCHRVRVAKIACERREFLETKRFMGIAHICVASTFQALEDLSIRGGWKCSG